MALEQGSGGGEGGHAAASLAPALVMPAHAGDRGGQGREVGAQPLAGWDSVRA